MCVRIGAASTARQACRTDHPTDWLAAPTARPLANVGLGEARHGTQRSIPHREQPPEDSTNRAGPPSQIPKPIAKEYSRRWWQQFGLEGSHAPSRPADYQGSNTSPLCVASTVHATWSPRLKQAPKDSGDGQVATVPHSRGFGTRRDTVGNTLEHCQSR